MAMVEELDEGGAPLRHCLADDPAWCNVAPLDLEEGGKAGGAPVVAIQYGGAEREVS